MGFLLAMAFVLLHDRRLRLEGDLCDFLLLEHSNLRALLFPIVLDEI